jgi:hypothetical protein
MRKFMFTENKPLNAQSNAIYAFQMRPQKDPGQTRKYCNGNGLGASVVLWSPQR